MQPIHLKKKQQPGNPFSENRHDLYVLDSNVIKSYQVVSTVQSVEDTDKAQFDELVY